ncbi:MAG: hypothetical protein JNL75_11345 [Chitinophagales bacterium]|nr:hypothetical protein [Chitinophagales bacterium]
MNRLVHQTIFYITFFLGKSLISQELSTITKQQPFDIKGSISLTGNGYIADGIPNRFSPLGWMISGTPTISLYGVQIPFSIMISEQNKDFSQPFARFGLSPTYKSLKLHLGHRYMTFNPYTLSGRNFLGAGIEWNPKIFRFAAMYGSFSSENLDDTAALYNSSSINKPNTIKPTYRQMGYGLKLGAGSKSQHAEIMMFRGYDVYEGRNIDFNRAIIKPRDNIAIGANTHFTFAKMITWDIKVGASVFTRDVTRDSLVLKSSDSSLLRSINSFFPIRTSTQLSWAGETSINFNYKNIGCGLTYKRIMPEYKSLGIFYIQGDLEQYFIAPSAVVWKNKLSLSGNLGIQRDNLAGIKESTNNSIMGAINVGFQANDKFGIDASYSNFGITQRPTIFGGIPDTTLIDQINHNATLTPRYTWIDDKKVINLILSLNYQQLVDLNRTTEVFTNSRNFTGVATHTLNLLQKKMDFTTSFTYNNTHSVIDIVNLGLSYSMNKLLAKDKLRIGGGISYFTNIYEGQKAGDTYSGNISTNYTIDAMHSLQAGYSILINNGQFSGVINSFSEHRFNVGYVFNFSGIKLNSQKSK